LQHSFQHNSPGKCSSGVIGQTAVSLTSFFHVNVQLINVAFDLGAMFDAAKGDVITRHTRFTCSAPAPAALKAIEAQAELMGGTYERRGSCRYVQPVYVSTALRFPL
jgi:hypothetical protein